MTTNPIDEAPERPDDSIEMIKPPKEKKIKKRVVDDASFHFVADWVSDSEIIYVEKKNGVYLIQLYDIYSGETTELLQEDSLVIDVQIHANKEYMLIHTSDRPDRAELQIRSLSGEMINEVEIESTELSVEWNDMNPSLLLLTAFHEDWSYDVFLYNGEVDEIQLLSLDDPFPKWYGQTQIVVGKQGEHPLDGSELQIVDMHTQTEKIFVEEGVVYFDTFEDELLTMTVDEELQQSQFTVYDVEGKPFLQWSAPAVSNYSEWVMPEIDWLEPSMLLFTTPKTAGLIDEIDDTAQLIVISSKESSVITEVPYGSPITCSSSKCLLGFRADKIVDVESGLEEQWLELQEN